MRRTRRSGKKHARRPGVSGGRIRLILLAIIAVTAAQLCLPAVAHAAGVITGVVTSDATGGPINNVTVTAYRDDGHGTAWWGGSVSDATNATGTYTVNNLKPGVYRLGFRHGAGVYAYEFLNDAPTLADGATVTVTDLATTTVNAQLALSAVVTGTITSEATGGPLPGKRVQAYRFEPVLGYWVSSGNEAAAGPDGAYVLRSGLRSGAYRLAFWDDDDTYTAEFYNNKTDWPALGDDVTVTAGTTLTGVNAALTLLAPDAYEPDDDAAHAVTATPGAPIAHTLAPDATSLGDRDWSWVNATVGKTYVLETLTTQVDTVLELYGPNGVTRLAIADDCTDQDNNSRLVWAAPATGRYYVRVRGWSPTSRGRYDLRITQVNIPAAPVVATLNVTRSSVRRGQQVRFYGQFTPTEASSKHVVSFQRYSGGRWSTVQLYRLNSTGRYSIFWSERTRVTRRFRLWLTVQVGWAAGVTPTKTVRWR